jgi:hypothetical protein
MLFLVLQKDGREEFAVIQPRLTLHQIRTPNYLFLSLTIRLKWMTKTMLIVCSVLVVSLKTTMDKSGYDVRNILDGHKQFLLVWRKVLIVSLVKNKHCIVLSLYPL